jgi:hypothetical protein
MKKTVMILTAIVMITGFTSRVMAQVTESNDANAVIITPITLVVNVALEFGNLAVQTGVAGTVELTAAAATVATPTAGVTLLTGTTRTAAKYTVGGVASYVYTITVPADGVVSITDGANFMEVSSFTFASVAVPSGTGGTLTAGGTDVFYVGGTLNVDAAQVPGTYTGTFDVTINYN